MSVPAAINAVTTNATGAATTAASTSAASVDAGLFQLLLGDAAGLDAAAPAPQGAPNSQGAAIAPQTSLGILSLQTEGGQLQDGDLTSPEALFGASSQQQGDVATAQSTPKSASQQQAGAQTGQTLAPQGQQPIATQIVALQSVQSVDKSPTPSSQTGSQDTEATDDAPSDMPTDNSGAAAPSVSQPVPTAMANGLIALNAQGGQSPDNAVAANTGGKSGDEPVIDSAFGPKAGSKKTSVAPGAVKQAGNQMANTPTAQINANAPAGPRPTSIQPALDSITSAQAPQVIGDSTISYPGAAEAPRLSADQAAAAPFSRSTANAAAASLAHQIVRRFDGGASNFQVRLDPPELGRVDVRLTVDKDKRVTAKIGADSATTLSELRGATREIERALSDAGLDLAQDGLSFDLNDQPQSNDNAFEAPAGPAAKEPTLTEASAPIVARPFGLERWGTSGVDVWA